MSGEEQDRILTGEWQYACEGKSAISTKNTAWGPVTGFDSSKKFGLVTTKYSHPALSENEDDSYPIRLKLADGTLTNEVKVYKAQKPVSSITLKEGVTVTLPYNADVSINFDALRERIFDMAGETFNLDSPKQLSRILFEVLGLTPLKKNQRGYSTDAETLESLRPYSPVIDEILKYRTYAKLLSTYVDGLLNAEAADGRVHSTFIQTEARTGRISSTEPNLQNIPVRTELGRRIREAFVAPEGGVFLSADYSQIELRLLAHLSGDEGLIDAFLSGEDFHAHTASDVFGVSVDEVTPEMRSRAKAVNFGIVYGQQAFGLGQTLHIPMAEAQEMIDRYYTAYPKVRQYLDDVVAQAHEDGYATTMFGRKRHIPELRSSNVNLRHFGERTAMNHPMQGSAADIIKLAMIQVNKRRREEGLHAHMVLQVHDELDFECPLEEADAMAALVADVMDNVVELKVPLIADVQTGPNWAIAH